MLATVKFIAGQHAQEWKYDDVNLGLEALTTAASAVFIPCKNVSLSHFLETFRTTCRRHIKEVVDTPINQCKSDFLRPLPTLHFSSSSVAARVGQGFFFCCWKAAIEVVRYYRAPWTTISLCLVEVHVSVTSKHIAFCIHWAWLSAMLGHFEGREHCRMVKYILHKHPF